MSTPVRLVPTSLHCAGIADECVAIEEFIALGSSAATRTTRRCIAAAFTDDFMDLTGWSNAGLANQLGAALPVRGVVARLLVATGCPASADYVVASGSSWGSHASIVHPQFAALFKGTALRLGFSIAQVRRQWNTLSKISVTAGSVPNTLSVNSFNVAAAALTDADSVFS